MSLYSLIALGGAIGAVLRFAIFRLAAERFDSALPWGTFTVNVTGSLLIGFLATMFIARWHLPINLQYAILAGLLGGFTTFSAFSLESLRLIEQGELEPRDNVYAGECNLVYSRVRAGCGDSEVLGLSRP